MTCWTAYSLPQMMREIHIDELPCLFQDAFHMTRDLGISYLWIVALCIVQDDPEHWSREVPKLPDYFANKKFNISAG